MLVLVKKEHGAFVVLLVLVVVIVEHDAFKPFKVLASVVVMMVEHGAFVILVLVVVIMQHGAFVVPVVVMPQTIHIIPQFVSSIFKTGFNYFPLINTKE